MRLGAHESVAGGLHLAIDRAVKDGCESLQIFVKSPNRWTAAALKDSEIKLFIDKAEKFGFNNINAHAAYLINLASPKDDVRQKSIESFKDELSRCNALKIPYYVLHPGSPLDSGLENGIRRIAYGIDEVFSSMDSNTMLLLEITAGMGNSIGGKFEHLEDIISKTKFADKVGICLDSCHMLASGYDIVNNYDKVMDDFFARFGDKFKIFHLNDSKNPLGSRKDRHELIGKGFIGEKTFVRIVNDIRMKDIAGILETPVVNDSYAEEVKLLKSFRK